MMVPANNSRILIAYHTVEGQTEAIARRLADDLRQQGHTVDVAAVGENPSPAGYDGAILGGSIHVGHHGRELARYAREHCSELSAHLSAFFSVSLTAVKDDEQHHSAVAKIL